MLQQKARQDHLEVLMSSAYVQASGVETELVGVEIGYFAASMAEYFS